jgi:hypothetical protein
LAAAAEAARLLKAHGSALVSTAAATAIPSTEEEGDGPAGLGSLWALKQAIDGLLLEEGATTAATAAVVVSQPYE